MSKACFECGEPAVHEHHVVPQARGGTRTVPLCGNCHAKAHDMDCASLASEVNGGQRWRETMRWDQRVDPPFGYSVDPEGALHEEPAEQAAMRRAVELRGQGLHYTEVASRLAVEGITARGRRPFTKERVAKACREFAPELASGKGQTRYLSPEVHSQAAALARTLQGQGCSERRIVRQLNEAAPPPYGRPWSQRQVRALLHGEAGR